MAARIRNHPPPIHNQDLSRHFALTVCFLSPTLADLGKMTSPISFTVRPPSAPYRPSPLGNGARRTGAPSRRLFEQGGDEDEEEGRGSQRRPRPRDESIDGIRNGRSHGYVRALVKTVTPAHHGHSGEKPAEPLVIAALPNRDWRQSSTRRTPSYRPEETRSNEPAITHERSGDGAQRSGLRHASRTEVEVNDYGVKAERTEVKIERTEGESSSIGSATVVSTVVVKSEPLSLEEQALQAILGGNAKQETEEERAQRELVIAMESNGVNSPITEDDALRRDVATLPQEVRFASKGSCSTDFSKSTLEDYDAIPVSAFGIAMARGMGWKPSSTENTAVHEPKLRPQLLGLGAKPMDVSVRPTHNRGDSKKKHQDRAARSGRGFVATSLLVKKEREGSESRSGSVTPAGSGSRLASPDAGSDGSRRRRREDDDESGREGKRRDGERNRDDRRERYETEDERARRKASERREKDRHSNGDRDRAIHGERERDGEARRERNGERGDRERERSRERDRGDDRDRRRHRERERERP